MIPEARSSRRRRQQGERANLSRLPAACINTELPAFTGLARAFFQSSCSDLSSSTVTPPWSSPEFQRAISALWRSRRGPLGKNLP